MTADPRTAVEAMRLGAYDCLVKPFDPDDLVTTVERAAEGRQLQTRNRVLERQLDVRARFEEIVGASARMRAVFEIDPRFVDRLAAHDWPGNVRELENVLERAVILARSGVVSLDTLPPPPAPATPDVAAPSGLDLPFSEAKLAAMAAFERRYLEHVLARAGGAVAEGARLAGLDPSNFRRLMRRVGVGPAAAADPKDPPPPNGRRAHGR